MTIPKIVGVIKRRFLVNYRIDPDVLAHYLPASFKPSLVNGYGVGGICLIRLEKIRPKVSPMSWGFSSENGAHRFAVTWEGGEGVYVPRRDTDSMLSHLAGGSIFPGVYHLAFFEIKQEKGCYDFSMVAKDGTTEVSFRGQKSKVIPKTSCFGSLDEASAFFEKGSVGYSDSNEKGKYDGMELEIDHWSIEAFHINQVKSSFFDDESLFPKGSVEFDHALIMENIEHEWNSLAPLACC